MKRRAVIVVSTVLLLALVASGQTKPGDIKAQSSPPPMPAEVKPIDPGRVEADRYVNDFFGLSFSFPKDWAVQDSAQKQAIIEHGKETLEVNADARKKAAMEASAARTAFLLSITKYPMERSPTVFNAHFGLMAERVPTAVIKTGADYFDAMLRVAQGSAAKLEPQGQVRSVRIGGALFSVMDAKLTLPQGVVAEKFYATIRNGYALLFSYAYVDESDAKAFDDIMKSVTFK